MGEVSTFAAAASALVAALGLWFTGQQLRLQRRQEADDRIVALKGVAVSWRAVSAPHKPEKDGKAAWRYEITVHNPGRLPIQDIVVTVTFQCDVMRMRYDGSIDEPTGELLMRYPVLAGGDRQTWSRKLWITYDDNTVLKETTAEVVFRDVNGVQRSNHWPVRGESDDRRAGASEPSGE